jgi:hypothetical protein
MLIGREQLIIRLLEFAADPIVDELCNEETETLVRLAADESEVARQVRQMQRRAEALARESFAMADADGVDAARYLLDLCDEPVVQALSSMIDSDLQLWGFSEYLLSRFAAARENLELFFNRRDFGRRHKLYETISRLVSGALVPQIDLAEQREFEAAAPPEAKVELFPTIIVHGTWAASRTWWREQPGQQNFWAYIRGYCSALFGAGGEFTWSGGNNHADREQGARDFINWWNKMGAPRPLQVIAHSHGCNVVYLACVMEPQLHIVNMVSLGAPVRTWYPPPIAMQSRISRIHNIYSRHDAVQPVGSIGGRRGEGRTLADSFQITNHHIPWVDPNVRMVVVGHGDLHDPTMWNNNGLASTALI